MTTLTISLPESLREFIDRQVKTKGYGNTSEYLRTLVRDAQEAESKKRLENLLREGLESGGKDIEADPKFWSDLKAEATALIAKRKKQG
ncbi:MAG TPA: type II toxin-antitoxin system ParD family antitoxin [Bryobacteraceae bacterium]|nr:type II toxin-antitoxin system ParD family antitoxin [Bryobacteraceae bacterium]